QQRALHGDRPAAPVGHRSRAGRRRERAVVDGALGDLALRAVGGRALRLVEGCREHAGPGARDLLLQHGDTAERGRRVAAAAPAARGAALPAGAARSGGGRSVVAADGGEDDEGCESCTPHSILLGDVCRARTIGEATSSWYARRGPCIPCTRAALVMLWL